MLSPEVRCVVGIDVAKSAHVVCALEAPSGATRLKSTPLSATAAGCSQLREWLQAWGEPAWLLLLRALALKPDAQPNDIERCLQGHSHQRLL